jgi:hypothetical protein
MGFAWLLGGMRCRNDIVTVLVRFGRRPHCETLYAGACYAIPEDVASLLGISERTARIALSRAGRFVLVPAHEHDEPKPMYIAVITSEMGHDKPSV